MPILSGEQVMNLDNSERRNAILEQITKLCRKDDPTASPMSLKRLDHINRCGRIIVYWNGREIAALAQMVITTLASGKIIARIEQILIDIPQNTAYQRVARGLIQTLIEYASAHGATKFVISSCSEHGFLAAVDSGLSGHSTLEYARPLVQKKEISVPG